MRPIDTPTSTRIGPRDAPCGDASQDATQFGETLLAAARQAAVAGPARDARPSMLRGGAADDPAAEASCEARPAATRTASPAAPRRDTARTAPASLAAPEMQPAVRTPAGAARATVPSRNGEASSEPDASRAPTPHSHAAQQGPDASVDPRDARPRTHATGHDRASQRSARRHADTRQPPEGVALQTLLAAAHPLLAATGNGAAATPAPSALTPHDVAASVTQAWLREPSTHDVAGADRGAQWTFTLGDPLTPLAALRISGDATAGWGLQLTAGNGLPARELAAHTERLRRRLRARGQAVDRLEVDDDSQR